MSSDKLEPCAHCGGKAEIEEQGYDTLPGTFFQVRCSKCPAYVESSHEPSARQVLNRRPAPSPSRMREALEEAIRQFKILRAQHLPGSQLYQEDGLTTNVYLNAADTGLAVSRAALSAPEQAGAGGLRYGLMSILEGMPDRNEDWVVAEIQKLLAIPLEQADDLRTDVAPSREADRLRGVNPEITSPACLPSASASAPVADEGSEEVKEALRCVESVHDGKTSRQGPRRRGPPPLGRQRQASRLP